MATLQSLARERKLDLARVRTQFLRTRAGFQAVFRELDRLKARKLALPELADLTRLTNLAAEADRAWDTTTQALGTLASKWR